MKRLNLITMQALLAVALPAYAQTSPLNVAGVGASAQEAPPANGQTTVQSVTVTGKAPAFQRKIDRRVYRLADDPLASQESVADAIRGIPSVDVDPSGNVSLRGDSDVTILIDGQPSALFQGPNRGTVLQQLPANRYDSVEVITTPSAAFRPEGSGGIINLVTKKVRPRSRTQTVNVSAGSQANVAVDMQTDSTDGPWSLSGGVGFRHQLSHSSQQTNSAEVDPSTGDQADVSLSSISRTVSNSLHANASIGYDIDKASHVSSELAVFALSSTTKQANGYFSSASQGPLAEDYLQVGQSPEEGVGAAGSTTFLRRFKGDNHTLTVRLSYGVFTLDGDSRSNFAYTVPATSTLFQSFPFTSQQDQLGFNTEYMTPLSPKDQLTAGYDLSFEKSITIRSGAMGADANEAIIDAALMDHFDYAQTIQALYITWSHTLGRLEIMPGVRLEQASINTDDVMSGSEGGQSYVEAYPSLHLSYRLNNRLQLLASYSRRITRVGASELDPFRVEQTPLSFTQGNPMLRPAITDSWESSLEYDHRQTSITATLYDRETRDQASPILEQLSGGALLTTFANIGKTRHAGIELVARAQALKNLSFSLTNRADWVELQELAINGVSEGSRDGVTLSSQAKINWSPSKKDFVQFDADVLGREINIQGYRSSIALFRLGYRRTLNSRLAAEIRLQDPFDSLRIRSVIIAPDLNQVSIVNPDDRLISVGLTYAFSGKPAAPTRDFQFESESSVTH